MPDANCVRKLLIVDDDTDTAIAISHLVQHPMVSIDIVGNGLQALSLARDLQPHAIILDARLPGMDGFELFRVLRGEPGLGGTRVIFVSAHAERGALVMAKDCGAFAWFRKPFPEEVLQRRIFEALGMDVPAEPGALPSAGPGPVVVIEEERPAPYVLVVAAATVQQSLQRRVEAALPGVRVVGVTRLTDVISRGRAPQLLAVIVDETPPELRFPAFVEYLPTQGIFTSIVQLTPGKQPAEHPLAFALPRLFRAPELQAMIERLPPPTVRDRRKPAEIEPGVKSRYLGF